MSLVFNMVGGAGGSAELPAIYVTYPEGSVCTCSNGSKTYTAKDTSGYWLFAGLDIGTWTVTATDGGKTASKAATITTEGQVVELALSFRLWLYDAGNQFVDVTGGWGTVAPWSSGAYGAGSVTYGAASITVSAMLAGGSYNAASAATCINNLLDLSGYKTLYLRVKSVTTGSSRYCSYGVSTERNNTGQLARTSVTDSGIIELDISAVTDPVYVYVTKAHDSGIAAPADKVEFDQVYAE